MKRILPICLLIILISVCAFSVSANDDLRPRDIPTRGPGDVNKYENEYNGSPMTADDIYSGYTVYGELSGDDYDYYKFTVNNDATFLVTCAADYRVTVFALFNSSGELLAESEDNGQMDALYFDSMIYSVSPGTYYLVFTNADASYTNNTYAFYFEHDDTSHTHVYTASVIAPTCTGVGYQINVCQCGFNYTVATIPALGHSFTNYISNNDATLEADGTLTAKCDRCNVTDTILDQGSKKSGLCGENVTWMLQEDSVLEITGTGDMYDFPHDEGSQLPWERYRSEIQRIRITPTVTGIGEGAFYGMTQVTNVSIAYGVKTIGSEAFRNCINLASVEIPGSVADMGTAVFYNCIGLKVVTIHSDVTGLGDRTFEQCSGLTEIHLPKSLEKIGDGAFRVCTQLRNVYFSGDLSQWEAITIGRNNTNLTKANLETLAYYHTHDYGAYVTAPTCADPGYTSYVCACGAGYDSDPVEALGHSYTYFKPNGNATCVKDGTMTGLCDRCQLPGTTTDWGSKLGHSFTNYISNNDATMEADGTKTAKCDRCPVTQTIVDEGSRLPSPKNGWVEENGNWYFYENGEKVTNQWREDTAGKCYLGEDGAMLKEAWALEGDQWRYLNWMGYLTTNDWAKDSWGWCFLDENGYWVKDAWRQDTKGWCYIDKYGYWLQKGWAKDSAGWCYMEGGYMIYNAWRQDTKGWCYIGKYGYQVIDDWAKDSVGWCYLGKDGYMVYNTWKADSYGWCYINKQGYLTVNGWARDNKGWYWMDASGYISKEATLTIAGKTYNFDTATGLCRNP